MPKRKGLTKQVQDVLDSKLKIGHSKHYDKKFGNTQEHIYSWNTYRTYLKHCCYFVQWAKKEHSCRDLDSARTHVDAYLRMRMDAGLSSYTIKLESSALAKLYGCSTEDFIKTKARHRADITRSRGEKVRDRHFSESNHKEFVDFCKATGLRRSELRELTKEQLRYDANTNQHYLEVTGKGGRFRKAPILTIEAVKKIQGSEGRVWKNLPNGADIHAYRAEYATAIYKQYARSDAEVPKQDRYYCRGDLKGIMYDKKAMAVASQALGHNRISVIAGHYIRR